MDLLADLRYAVRVLRKTPVFTLAAIGTLALGIGANTTIFSLVQTVLLRPLPYQNPDQVVMVWEDATAAGFPRNTPAPGNYNDWRVMNRSFADMAATGFAFANLTGDGGPELVVGRRVTANFFSVLGVQPVLGRAFTAADDTSGARVAVISHALWQRRYGGDPGIIGRTISMSSERRRQDEVVGVAPPSFVFISREVDYWVPIQFSPEEAATRRSHYLNVVARLKPGVSVEAAGSDMQAIARRLSDQHAETNRDLGTVVVSIREQVLGDTRVQVIALMTAAAAIVLIACANLASLLLARASVRRGEYAVRLSLGASRGRLARQVLVEALCLSTAGGVLGLAIPVLTTTFVERIVPVGLQAFTVSLDFRLLAFAAGLSIVTGALFSLGPALQSAHASTAQVLQQHARGNAGGRSRMFRDGLVVLQVAATLVLLVAAGLMLRTLANLNAVELGFDANNLLTMQVALPVPKYADPIKRQAFYERVIADVRALPGVRGAAFGSTLPFQAAGNTRFFCCRGTSAPSWRHAGRVVPCGDGRLSADASGDAGRGAPARRARWRRRASRRGRQRDARPAIHARTIGARPTNPVRPQGAVVHRRRRRERRPRAWIRAGVEARPVRGAGTGQRLRAGNLIVRVDGDPLGYSPAVQRIVRAVDPDQPTRLIRSMTEFIGLTVGDRRQQTTLLVVFGTLALVIASLGLYGLLAQTVSARGREIGIRMALGATWRNVMHMVMSRGIALTGAGVGIGAVLAWSVTRAMETLLFGVGSADPLTFALVAGLLATVSAVACAIPAVRAARVDPMLVLRDQ